jgi:Zn-dependent protease with chaperone function
MRIYILQAQTTLSYMPKPFFITVVFTFYSFLPAAQMPASYIPLKEDSATLNKLLKETEANYKLETENYKGAYKKDFIEITKERYDYIKQQLTGNSLITSGEAYTYLQNIVSEIVKNNPVLKKTVTRILFSRAYWPNAVSLGEGTILFNIGLFHKLNNEAQAAFVLGHELAHLYLNHSGKSIEKYISTVNSEVFQKELKSISKSEYGQRGRVEKLIKGVAFDSRRHSRNNENEADDMAIEFLKSTNYDLSEALSCLALLDTVDLDKYKEGPAIDKHLHFATYPFQKKWIQEERKLFTDDALDTKTGKKEEDSLKTHPDCKIRIAKLEPKVKQLQKPGNRKFIVSEELFNKYSRDFDFEILDYCYRSNNLSRCLYFALEILSVEPGNLYAITKAGNCLNQFYINQKKHELNKITDLPGPFYDKKYNTLLRFIQNIRLADIASIAYYFMLQYETKFSADEDFLNAVIISKENAGKNEEKQKWITIYKQQFPKGKYKFN